MFGYIVANLKALPEDRQQRFRAVYCGLCHTLRARHGLVGGATLSYDLTFLALLLNALYEPDEQSGRERCAARPTKPHDYTLSPVMEYVADMNIALAYYKCLDNWTDDRSVLSGGEGLLLRRGYQRVKQAHPDRCEAIEEWIEAIQGMERAKVPQPDPPVNATGRLLGKLFVYPGESLWADALRAVGDGLGRFVYFMDAYDDLSADLRRGRYNPLRGMRDREDFEEMCHAALMMMAADATEAFEGLPIVRDADILRNVLYSGIWSRYAYLQEKRKARRKGAE